MTNGTTVERAPSGLGFALLHTSSGTPLFGHYVRAHRKWAGEWAIGVLAEKTGIDFTLTLEEIQTREDWKTAYAGCVKIIKRVLDRAYRDGINRRDFVLQERELCVYE